MFAFQTLFVLFALFAIVNVFKRKKDGILSLSGALFWSLFWVLVAVAVVWPNSTQLIADNIGIGRGSDLVIYISIAVLFFLIFKLHIKIEKINRDVTKVVRRKALQKSTRSLKH